ncbi:ABC transporter ATP-binding protein [Streptococcus sp.]
MLECKDITVNYQGKTVLDHCNLSIKKGEIVGIMGESGSGKSTLARVILGIEKPSQGQVLLDGKTYSIKEDGVRILVVFQDSFHAVNPRFTVREILLEALPKDFPIDKVHTVLTEVGLPSEVLGKRARELSGGQLQRVCIARTLLLNPDIIIFDESLSGLDPKTQLQILQLLYKLHAKYQNTFIFIAHDEQLCQAICDRILILENGQFIREIQDLAEAT